MQVADRQFVKSPPVKENHPEYWRSQKNSPTNQAFNPNIKSKGKK